MLEYQLLLYFLHNPGRLIKAEEIAVAIWRDPDAVQNFDICLSRLRSKIGREMIINKPRHGYMLNGVNE
jgi:DNA-binding response OmpR family regulator